MKPELRMKVAAMAKTLGIPLSKYAARILGQRVHRSTWQPSGSGAQETARRRRQIERGQLTKSNGLVS